MAENAFERFEEKQRDKGKWSEPSQGEEALKQLAQSPQGRKALNFIMHLTPFYSSMFTGDPYQDAFLGGQRHVALLLRSFFDKDTLELIERERV